MPIYEFECEWCGEKFEKFCNINFDESKICCPMCAMVAKKVISQSSFVIDKFRYKPLKKSKPKSYIPTLHDIKKGK